MPTLSLVHNISALVAQRNLASTTVGLAQSASRLSSGLRITTAADDAAGLAVSERLRAQTRSLAQAERNANDGVSLLQTADGALNEVGDLLIRMRELAVQASNGTLGTSERQSIADEFSELSDEIDRIAEVTEFNGQKLLDGSVSGLSFQVGIASGSSNQIDVTIDEASASALGLSSASLSTAVLAEQAIDDVDSAIDALSTVRGQVGASLNRFDSAVSNLQTAQESLTTARSRIVDVDYASEVTKFTQQNILLQAGIAVLAQANQQPSYVLSLLQSDR